MTRAKAIDNAISYFDSGEFLRDLERRVGVATENILDMPTIGIPHSYAACSQHAPNEHLLANVAREALQIVAGLFWDLGASGFMVRKRRQQDILSEPT